MKRRSLLGLIVVAPAVGALRTRAAQDSSTGDVATVAALQTQVAVLSTKIALETQIPGLQTQAAGGNAAEPQATPATPLANVLYQADWSKGLDGWRGDPVWSTANGRLTSVVGAPASRGAGLYEGMIFAPYTPPQGAAFAVEAEIRIVNAISLIGGTGVFAKADDANDAYNGGYHAGNESPQNQLLMLGNHHQGDAFWSGVNGRDYLVHEMDNDWHVYRLEVNGDALTFGFDGAPVVNVTDAEFQTGRGVGVYAASYQVEVRAFRVLAL